MNFDKIIKDVVTGKVTKEELIKDAKDNVKIYGTCTDGSGSQVKIYLRDLTKVLEQIK